MNIYAMYANANVLSYAINSLRCEEKTVISAYNPTINTTYNISHSLLNDANAKWASLKFKIIYSEKFIFRWELVERKAFWLKFWFGNCVFHRITIYRIEIFLPENSFPLFCQYLNEHEKSLELHLFLGFCSWLNVNWLTFAIFHGLRLHISWKTISLFRINLSIRLTKPHSPCNIHSHHIILTLRCTYTADNSPH